MDEIWIKASFIMFRNIMIFELMAERMGFEPTIRSPAYTLSKRAP